MKCAISCEINCFEVSNIHIFQGLCGFYLNLLIMRTEKDKTPSPTCITIPSRPVIEQLVLT